MDIDVMSKHVTGLLAFKAELEGLLERANGNAGRATAAIDDVMSFKAQIEKALPDIEKLIADTVPIADDIAKIKQDLAPALEWIAEQQKAAEAAKAAEAQKVEDAAKASQEHGDDNNQATEVAPVVEKDATQTATA